MGEKGAGRAGDIEKQPKSSEDSKSEDPSAVSCFVLAPC